MKLGELSVTSLIDGAISGAPATGFPDKTADDWVQWEHYLQDGKLVSDTGGFLVSTGDRLVLIDAGGGPPGETASSNESVREQLVKMFEGRGLSGPALEGVVALTLTTSIESGHMPESMRAAGVRAEDVTDVIFTHLHSDHIGWASADGTAYFPNATYHCSRTDFDYFHGPDVDEAFSQLVWGTPLAREKLAPVLPQLEVWDSDTTIAPGIDVRLAPGHTPGSSVVVLSSGGQRALILGDMAHCPFELQDPEWQLIGDVDRELARQTREAYIRELEDGQAYAAGSHFPGLNFGRLMSSGNTRSWSVFT
ncbi:MBL fold metallo-hydrolase [Mycobacterium seoulense]|uniref:MBL fold metallo-hydrolase n=1 Tax=Mycobacterium seoulense TaxID=386911 RepID=UPI003CF72729